jgi:hypothetical protein
MDRAASGDAVAEPKETAGEAMARFDPDTMSPRDALQALYALRDLL